MRLPFGLGETKPDAVDRQSGEPDYNALVRVAKD